MVKPLNVSINKFAMQHLEPRCFPSHFYSMFLVSMGHGLDTVDWAHDFSWFVLKPLELIYMYVSWASFFLSESSISYRAMSTWTVGYINDSLPRIPTL